MQLQIAQQVIYEFDVELKQPTIKSVSEAANMAEQLRDFAQSNGHQELSLVLSKLNDILSYIKLRKPKQQTLISNYFSSWDKWVLKTRFKRLGVCLFLTTGCNTDCMNMTFCLVVFYAQFFSNHVIVAVT